jgi:hypothetical protein
VHVGRGVVRPSGSLFGRRKLNWSVIAAVKCERYA